MRGDRPPGSFVGREQELAGLCAALGETSNSDHLFFISVEPEREVHSQTQSPSNLVACFRSIVLSLAALIEISSSPVLGVMLAHADGGRLVTIAAQRFQNLTVAERRLLEYADIGNQHRDEFSVGGTSAEPKDPTNDPAQSASWPIQRNIRAELIRWLLVDRTATTLVDPKGIHVLGARIVGNLDLSNVHAERAIALVRCRLDRVNLDLAEIESLDLSGSYTSSVHADHVVAHGSMFLGWDGTYRGGDFHCSGKVSMPGARVDGELCFGGGRFQHLNVDPEYWEASIKVAIDARNSEVRDDLTVCCSFEAHGAVALDNATIGKALDAVGGRFINPDNVAISASNLSAANVMFAPGPDYPSEDSQIDGVLDFTTAQIQNNFSVWRTKFRGKAFERHGFIGAALAVGKGFVWKEVTLENGAFLDLRGSHLGGLCDDKKSWPIPGKLLIDGLTYSSICGDVRLESFFGEIEDTASPTDAASRLKWLRLQPRFFPQPYKQLANWMRENGDDAGATRVLTAKAEAESESSEESAKLLPARSFLEKSLPALILFTLVLATLLVTATSYFSRRNRKRASAGLPASLSVEAAPQINRSYSPGQRGTERVESERRASRLSAREVGPLGATVPGESAEGLAVFKRQGDYWTVAYRDSAFRLKDVKGLAYIAFLLARPGERIHVHELIARVDGVAAGGGSELRVEVAREVSAAHDLGDAGITLDQQARAEYRRQLRDLAEDLAEAERLNDIGRAERLRSELEFLKGELSAAIGIGGRNRKTAAQGERARGMVSKNIRAGLEKIRSKDAALGRYFAASIKTGYYCAYLPDPERKISWQL